jgi:hypothetical protein
MRSSDVKAVGEVAGIGLGVVTAVVRDTHHGIASRVFRSIGPGAIPVRQVHHAIAGLVYAAVDRAARQGPVAVAAAAAVVADDTDPPLHEHPRLAEAIAALDGIYGDELADRRSSLAIDMGVRVAGRAVPPTADALADAFPAATGRLAVFVHGLCQTEKGWSRPARNDLAGEHPGYGELLRADFGYTPVLLRYNTGRHISTNGQALDQLVTALVDNWPVPVTEVALIGHSMGGLVARSACHYAVEHERSWSPLVRHVVCLGSPHLGADLEKGVNAATWALARLPETRGVAAFLNLRSDGIKDLRYGACLDDDWDGADPDALLCDSCGEVQTAPNARYYFVAATAAPPVVGGLLGDHLVRPASAAARSDLRRSPFAEGDGLAVRGAHHFDLLNHPDVYARLRDWLAPAS